MNAERELVLLKICAQPFFYARARTIWERTTAPELDFPLTVFGYIFFLFPGLESNLVELVGG